MDEEKIRESLQTFFKEYNIMAKKINALVETFMKEAPIKPDEVPRALTIFDDEIEKAQIPDRLKFILKITLHQTFEKTPYVV